MAVRLTNGGEHPVMAEEAFGGSGTNSCVVVEVSRDTRGEPTAASGVFVVGAADNEQEAPHSKFKAEFKIAAGVRVRQIVVFLWLDAFSSTLCLCVLVCSQCLRCVSCVHTHT